MSPKSQNDLEGPPPLAVASVIVWSLLSGLSTLVALLFLLARIPSERPALTAYAISAALAFAVEARWVWKGRRHDLALSAFISLLFAALWWLVGTGEMTGFAVVPPVLMVVAGVSALGARRPYRAWYEATRKDSKSDP